MRAKALRPDVYLGLQLVQLGLRRPVHLLQLLFLLVESLSVRPLPSEVFLVDLHLGDIRRGYRASFLLSAGLGGVRLRVPSPARDRLLAAGLHLARRAVVTAILSFSLRRMALLHFLLNPWVQK